MTTTMFSELDALNTQVQKNKTARDAAEVKVTELAKQLVDAHGNPAKEKELSDQIASLVTLITSNDDATKIKELTAVLAANEKTLREATTTTAPKKA